MPDESPALEVAVEKLYARTAGHISPGLDVIQALLRQFGNPERSYPTIHVAGTNGKGSVCAIIESVLTEMGVRVGLFTSPHLVRFNERFRIERKDIDDAPLLELIQEVEGKSPEIATECGREPTFFEISTSDLPVSDRTICSLSSDNNFRFVSPIVYFF